jgi:beta-galactosidase
MKPIDTRTIPINKNWRFMPEDCEEAWFRGYDDSSWETVTLPHDWSVMYPFSEEYSSGTGYLRGGVGWYRHGFTLPEEMKNRRISLCFDGIYKNSQVWINSYYLGKRPSGYTSFSYDVTSLLNFGDNDNVISVKVSHRDMADSRWFTGSGITRKVYLRVGESLNIGENGTWLTTESANGNRAEIRIHHEIENDSLRDERIALKTSLLNREGKECFAQSGSFCINGGEHRNITLEGTMGNPRFWSDRDPYLYEMVTRIFREDGSSYTASRVKTGVRTLRFDPDRGFFLNGKNTLLKGVCVHHDGGCLGAAMHREVWERRLLKLREMGCNAIRCSHNPHMPELYDLCDELGFLMMDEAFDEWENPKNKWSTGHNVYPSKHQGYYEDFPRWHEDDLAAMVRRDRIHPSVIMYSIGNEIDYPNDPYCHPSFELMTGNNDRDKPEQERIFSENRPNMERLLPLAKELADIVRREDPSRPVTLAAAFPELSSRIGLFESLDVVGYNYKEQFYDRDHERFPDLPILGSENGHGYRQWKDVTDRPFIPGQFLWTGIDFLGETRGWPSHGSEAGLLTLAGYEKSRYYKRQALWAEEPVIRITCLSSKDAASSDAPEEWLPFESVWDFTAGEPVRIRLYTNQPSAELFMNGVSLGIMDSFNDIGCLEREIPFEPGALSASGRDGNGEVRAVHTLQTPGKGKELHLKRFVPAGRDGSFPIEQIEISLTDGAGVPLTSSDIIITPRLTGPGEIIGLENGNLSDNTPYSSKSRFTWKGKLITYIRRTGEGELSFSAEGEGISGRALTF